MGTGWRRAFCTSIFQDSETDEKPKKEQNQRGIFRQSSPSSSPGSCVKFTGGGSLLRRRCIAGDASSEHPLLSPALDDMNFAGPYTPPPSTAVKGSPKLPATRSNPASPRSPFRFALLKASLRLSRSRCGVCSQSVRAGKRTAVFTADCSHSFHFPCISSHVSSHAGSLSCPVCSTAWNEVPLLSSSLSPVAPLLPSPFDKDLSANNELKQSNNVKIYDDDEPLLISSKFQIGCPASHFNPILEIEDDGEGEIIGGNVEVAVSSEAAFVSADRNFQSYTVSLKVKAPAFPHRSVSKVTASVLDPSCRAPIDLVTVLDVSGSMTAAKLQILKRAMRLLISSLCSADRLSIVAFSVEVKRLLPLVKMSRQGQRSARQIVDRLIIFGGDDDSRCVGHALRKATKVLEDRRERNPVATIMLLSDCHQDQHQEDNNENHLSSPFPIGTRFAHLEIPTGCSAELAGSHVRDAFSKCVSGMVSLVLQDVHLQLDFPAGFVSSVYSYTAGGGSGGEMRPVLPLLQREAGNGLSVSIKLGDFYAEEKRELLVELKLPATTVADQRHDFLSFKSCYRDPTSRELIICREKKLSLPPLLHSTPETTSVRELRSKFIATRAMVESRRLSDLNDHETASHLLSTARTLLMQSNAAGSHSPNCVATIELRILELQRQQRRRHVTSSSSSTRVPEQQLTPTSAWRAAEQLAKVAILRKSMGRVGDLHGFENARF